MFRDQHEISLRGTLVVTIPSFCVCFCSICIVVIQNVAPCTNTINQYLSLSGYCKLSFANDTDVHTCHGDEIRLADTTIDFIYSGQLFVIKRPVLGFLFFGGELNNK